MYSLNKESYSQDWGGLRWGLAYFHLLFLFLPGFVFYSLNENAPICTELASSSTHTLLGPSSDFLFLPDSVMDDCVFLEIYPCLLVFPILGRIVVYVSFL